MKKLVIIATLMLVAGGLKAQDCEALMLPYFRGNVEQMNEYRDNAPEKFMYRCVFAQAAFYESDTIPAGAEVMDISKVVEYATGKFLSNDIVIDLNTFSFYAYNFDAIQVRNNSFTERTCFATPRSRHPYLVLRSANEMRDAADEYLESALKKLQY